MKHICFAISSLHCGGSERVLTTLANGLVKDNYKVSIVLISVSTNESFYELDKRINVVPLLSDTKQTFFIKRVKQLKKLFAELKPDVVVSFLPHISIYCYFALRKQKIHLVCSERNDPHQYKRAKKLLLRHCFKKVSGTVFQTGDACNFYKKAKNPIVIPNPVYLSEDTHNKFPEPKKFFISVGRLEKQKRFDLLIDAFNIFHKKHPDYSLRIYGDGSLKSALSNQVSRSNAEEYISIKPSNKQWHFEAKEARGFISTSDYEGMPNALEEALCLGCYCIATDCPVGGSKYLINTLKNGILVSTGNIDSIVDGLEASLQERQKINVNYDFLKPKNIQKQWESYLINFLQNE